jgi:hypothetical protein
MLLKMQVELLLAFERLQQSNEGSSKVGHQKVYSLKKLTKCEYNAFRKQAAFL